MPETQKREGQASGEKSGGTVFFSLIVGYLITGLLATIVLAAALQVAIGSSLGWLSLLIFPAFPIFWLISNPSIEWIALFVFAFAACSFLVWKSLNAKGKSENGV